MSIALPWKWIRLCVVLLVAIVAVASWSHWWPRLNNWVTSSASRFRPSADAHDHEHDDHAHAGHSHEDSVQLTPQAMRNLGLNSDTLRPLESTTFYRSLTVPGLVVEKPGRTRLQVATPMTAIVVRIHATKGESVRPGELLFELRLTHEDLVTSQTEFLKLLGELDVERKELTRLEQIMEGAIAGRLILERQYEVDRLEALLAAQREALRLHGLTAEQVASIERERTLLRTLQVYAPSPDQPDAMEFRLTMAHRTETAAPAEGACDEVEAPGEEEQPAHVLILDDLRVHPGQAVLAGETLCVLADYERLYIEGQAFEQDADGIMTARHNQWPVTAVFEGTAGRKQVSGLKIAFVANEIDVSSRTLHFYIDLPNELLAGEVEADGRFVTWRYRPGQRLQLRVPIERWTDEFVVPVAAVAQEGAESYLFLQNGDHFDRVPVHVKYRDQFSAVIAKGRGVYEGDVVALTGAHQLQMALKNKSGGAVDPHAGHNH